MEVFIQLDFYGVDSATREALRTYADGQVRRALHGDRDTLTRAALNIRRDHLPGSPERWSAQLDLASRWGAAHAVQVTARSSRPQGAIDDAIVAGWSELHARQVREVG